MAATPPVCDFGWKAPDFRLPATDGNIYALGDIAGKKGTVIMFICNHCPYVKSVLDRIVRDATDLKHMGIGTVAISANDAGMYPEDSFENMARVARQNSFPFPYLYDESQDTARAYGAVCTPDFFGFNAGLGLQYRGRLDASGRKSESPNVRRDLFEAMTLVAGTGAGPEEQIPSMGCSIKWKDA
ncbi:MAG: thioredoxin family protein [Rhodobacter sp.]|nr:thioredoxin family protein [Rhodobacter sp.]MCY4168406.1 thioredoxin family protein [Rhodobacter sp.]MCY4241121.1 thioredoxin family protein [Rhodobacter sp.]